MQGSGERARVLDLSDCTSTRNNKGFRSDIFNRITLPFGGTSTKIAQFVCFGNPNYEECSLGASHSRTTAECVYILKIRLCPEQPHEFNPSFILRDSNFQ